MTITYLYVLSGPLKGYKLRLEPGFTLGRASAHYNLKDPKTSEIHCIVAEQGGKLYLLDNKSKNGLWADNEMLDQIELKHKKRLKIGRTHLEVRRREAKQAVATPKKNTSWLDGLKIELNKIKPQQQLATLNELNTVTAFTPPLRLTFINGVQTDESWIVGYGPREVGSAGHEFHILQQGAPAVCFKLAPSDSGGLLTTEHKDSVLVNGKSSGSHVLKNNDEIQVLDTILKVEYFE